MDAGGQWLWRRPLPPVALPLLRHASSGRGRLHAFWECTLALAVRDQLVAGLAAASPAIVVPVERQAVWLLQPPAAVVCKQVWAVVSMCAVAAMEFGRARTWATGCGWRSS